MFGTVDPRVVYALTPALLNALILVAGLVHVTRRWRTTQPWSQMAVGGLGLLLLTAVSNMAVVGSTFTSRWLVDGGLVIEVVSLLLVVGQILGMGLLVAAVVTGRAFATADPRGVATTSDTTTAP